MNSQHATTDDIKLLLVNITESFAGKSQRLVGKVFQISYNVMGIYLQFNLCLFSSYG